jgi:hypothetical protein
MKDTEDNNTIQEGGNETKSRRSVLAGFSGAALGLSGILAGTQRGSATEELCPVGIDRDSFEIMSGTEYATNVYVNESAFFGPTVVIIGGIHGDEPAGSTAAHRINDWEFDCGTLVVIPEANVVALEQGTRMDSSGDLNRQFPPGDTPETELAQELWDTITGVDPDVVIDLHTSQGIWESDEEPEGYGQAIFSTQVGDAPEIASRTADYLNENYVNDSYPESYQFQSAASISGERPLLVHKVAADLELPGYITEATRYETDIETRITWTKAMARSLLAEHGIEILQ